MFGKFFCLLFHNYECIPNFLLSFSVVPGGRDVFADVIRVSTPNNFFPCQLALAAGIGLFHGILLRRVTGGQLPVVILSIVAAQPQF